MFICDNNKAGFLFIKMRFFHYKFSVSLSLLKPTKDKSIETIFLKFEQILKCKYLNILLFFLKIAEDNR